MVERMDDYLKCQNSNKGFGRAKVRITWDQDEVHEAEPDIREHDQPRTRFENCFCEPALASAVKALF